MPDQPIDYEVLALIVATGDHHVAVPVERVEEVVRMAWISTLPDAPSDVLGCLTFRGESMVVIDLYARLGIPPEPIRADQVLIVVNARGRRLGLRASSIVGLTQGRVGPLPAESGRPESVVGMLDSSPPVPVLDVDVLLRPEIEHLEVG